MPQRSQSVVMRVTSDRSRERVYHFYDQDNNRMQMTFNDLVFLDGALLHPSHYSISHDDGLIMYHVEPASRLQAVKL